MTTRSLLAITAAVEAVTGFVALVYPPALVGLVFGTGIAGAGIVVSRLAGISLIALAITCWPGDELGGAFIHRLAGMLSYNVLASLYLGWLGIGAVWVGPLLWPVVILHLVLTMLCAQAWLTGLP